uniref:Uncharacterized protein n=1 Tax=Arundo donax TaxID=35708 RepID=A0A0A8ZY48_ARUDO
MKLVGNYPPLPLVTHVPLRFLFFSFPFLPLPPAQTHSSFSLLPMDPEAHVFGHPKFTQYE